MSNLGRISMHRAQLFLGATLLAVALVVPAVAAAANAPTTAPQSHGMAAAQALAVASPALTAADVRRIGNGRLFKSTCTPSHIAMDDPIVYPNQPGKSHEHVFFGNVTTDAFSTYTSLVGQATSCRITADSAAYWIPALYDDGRAVAPRFANAYYLADGARGHIVAFPAGLKVIAGDSHATTAQSTLVLGWKCANQAVERLSALPTACQTGVDQVLVMRFPDCWNGHDLDSSDHKSHLAYRIRGVCPSGYPVALPRLSLNVHYRLPSLTGLTLASGSIYSAHADFFNAWNQQVLEGLVARNLN
jgi:hypothetical protein